MGWVAHLVVDTALALGLLIAGAHGNNPDYYVLDAAGAYLVVSVVATAGRGRGRRRLPRPFHLVLDGLVALGLAASPAVVVAAHIHLDVFATVMAEAVAVILGRDAIVTRGTPPLLATAAPIEVTAYETEAGPRRPPLARRLGRVSGTAGSRLPATARRAGRLAGRAARKASEQARSS
jgi:hypothetical protein